MRYLQHTGTPKWFTFKLAFLCRNIKSWSYWAVCHVRLQIYRPCLPSQALTLFAISHFVFPLLIKLCYFFNFTYFGGFLFCLPSEEAKNYRWKLWIKSYVLKAMTKHVLNTHYNDEIYLQYIYSHMNKPMHTSDLVCSWQPNLR